ncbi:MAG TPA: aspartyl protease family protein [Bryobacteraceae bacterium]|jgi:predicted aspartyl protease|nr:aspartyl protease family protein [Bryobacteraceae bacterium]
MFRLLLLCLAFALTGPILLLADASDGVAVYKTGDYETAIPLLRAAAAKTPQDPLISAALLSALVYEGRVDEAADTADADASAFPNSPEVMAARGEFAYYMSDMGEAEKLFRAALKLKDETPRAYYGLYRIFHAASLYRSARILCLKAHELDPDDALLTLAFLRYAAPARREELEGPFRAAHPWFYKHFEQSQETASDVKGELNGRKIFELEGQRQETTFPIYYLMSSPTHVRGVGVEVSIQGARPVRLVFDTGASGILISQSTVDKLGLNHLGSFEVRGVGDKGARSAFAAVADTCKIGTLQYKTCMFRVLEGKGRVAGDDDGLIGADFFSDYLIHIDFKKRLLHLTPLPDRPPNSQGYDRVVGDDEKSFTPVFRYGPHLYVLTKVNGKTWGLFLLDTGSSISNLDSTFARLSTKIRGNEYMRVKGVSGSVKDVFEADKAELQFARFRQSNLGLIAFNLNNAPEHQDFRMAGILGLPVLSMFRLTIDYRNGLVGLDYDMK